MPTRSFKSNWLSFVAIGGACFVSAICVKAASSDGLDFFEKRIRPLLTERCYECHSADKKQKGGLRLDTRDGWSKGGDTGPALVPGEPEKSLLIKAVRYGDPALQMPPKKRLDPKQIADLEQWIKMGAPDPRTETFVAAKQSGLSIEEGRKFWAYQSPVKPALPKVRDTSWPRNDIDYFILQKIERKNLKPVGDATHEVLARRVYFDLIGLPPTPEQIDHFLNDTSPDAYARLIDRLLASSHFGEHWARHWFDVARFAQSVVLRGLVFKEAWRYRDYVIDVFNRDVPFDQFIKEQIAGDLLPYKSVEQHPRQLVATTFLAMGNSNLEEQDKKQLDMDVVDEQLDTIGKAFLAQTIGCARCHDHKFDPIPTRDYYAMAGILRNVRTLNHANVSSWIDVPLPVKADEERRLAQHEKQVADLQAELKAARDSAKALAGKSAEPKNSEAFKPSVIAARDLPGLVVDSAQAKAVGEWKHSQYSKHYIGDGYWHDNNVGKGEKTLTFVPEITRAGRYEVRFAYVHAPSRAADVPVTVFHADGETTVHVNEQDAPVIDNRFISLGQFRFEANGFGYVLVATEKTKGYVTADAIQLLPADSPNRAEDSPSPLKGERAGVRGEIALQTTTNSEVVTLNARIKRLETRLKNLTNSGPIRPKSMSVIEQQKIEDAPVHIRGSVHTLGATVPRGFLSVALHGAPPALPKNQSGRRELAEWIAASDNPLTARVFVNRVWTWLMGEGLVRTPDNFGTTGERPSHPELLDYLATQFIEQGWSSKKLIREILLSHTYQLSTFADTKLLAADQENRLFARMNRRRLNAECLRDAMLSISGQLDFETGGPNIPSSLTAEYGYKFESRRRSVYLPLFRNSQPEIFEAFDLPSPSLVTGRRTVSTVPTQALFVMNNSFVRDQAEAAARRILSKGDDARLVEFAYRVALGRAASEKERTLVLKYLADAHGNRTEAWTEVFHTLFACLDFRYLN